MNKEATTRRQKMRQQMAERTKEAQARTEDKGFTTIFRNDLEKEPNLWKCEKGDHIIAVVPYETGDHDPYAEKGDYQYVLDIWVHRIGVANEPYICTQKTYATPCSICEECNRLQESGDYSGDHNKELWKRDVAPLRPKRRSIYNVIVFDSEKEEEEGVRIWEVSHFFMQKHLDKISKRPRGGGIIPFSSPDMDGKDIAFSRDGDGATNTKFDGHRFEDRAIPLSDEVLDQARCLDDLLLIPSYEELRLIFFGKQKSNLGIYREEEDEVPKRTRKRIQPPVEGGEEEETPKRARRRVQPSVEEEDEDEAPKRTRKRIQSPVEEEDNFDDFDPLSPEDSPDDGDIPY